MSSLTPTSPLMTLVVKPTGDTDAQALLGRFHPIMKTMGFGSFFQEGDGLYQAGKDAETILGSPLCVFAEVDGNSVVINIDGHSIFGLKGVEDQLKKIQTEYENSIDCSTELNGPNYASAFIGNLMYTAVPIYLSATIIVLAYYYLGSDRQILANIYLYATLGVIGAKTRFWVVQRRKQRPVWISVLFLILVAPTILAIVGGLIWLAQQFG